MTKTQDYLQYYLQLTLLIRNNLFAKVKFRIKYKMFLWEPTPNITNWGWKIQFVHWQPANSIPFKRNKNVKIDKTIYSSYANTL